MSLKVKISEQEILEHPNDTQLGSYVRGKYFASKKINGENNILDVGQIPDYDVYDKCVICGKDSPYKTSTHIDMRLGYVDGVGQGCFSLKECEKK
jgi:hypothetical protein